MNRPMPVGLHLKISPLGLYAQWQANDRTGNERVNECSENGTEY